MAKGKLVANTRIDRENDRYVYFVKNNAIYQAPRRGSRGQRKKVVQFGPSKPMNYSKSIYYVDGRGNVRSVSRKNSRGRGRSHGQR